ncbi:MAG TPA: Stp1/IreP family PP2C-type Ser/Thr phosphatase, partial [Betaproteobacteria bacterium]|nr:Stp1/IreP family PP2C-type Ser/Thr phosphatase [Betaproteobacteria bacterium]
MTHLSDSGKVRPHNEDAVASDPACGVAVLADGMGGYNAGEVASGIAVTMIAGGLRTALQNGGPRQALDALLRAEVEKANHAIYQAAQSQPQYGGMGTTAVAAVFFDNRVTVAHVGDSRLYRVRDGALVCLTRDHSLLQEQIDSGVISVEAARHSRNKNLVTRALGVDPTVLVEVGVFEVLPGDLYLLCSDGLNDMVADEEIGMALNVLGVNLPLAAQHLVALANDHGGRDNISVILVRAARAFPDVQPWLLRLWRWLGKWG